MQNNLAILPRKTNSRLPYLALAVGVLSISFSAILVRTANAPGMVSSLYRMAIAALLLAWPFSRQMQRGGLPDIERRGVWFAIAGGLFFAIDMVLWCTGAGPGINNVPVP